MMIDNEYKESKWVVFWRDKFIYVAWAIAITLTLGMFIVGGGK